ncbi:hypothetical protein SAMN05421510_11421 [Nitrosomonas ureae]|uniref:Uncharacterized protein n=1 Tax=Nitrosomonas ureae TaxID=44577 RepID=A0A1H9HS68_9PROT|nr:hypothetical protein C8R27_15012 [Nitrosomonas ureae]SEQ65209.1 hypothetical protein SAMN05421510_11421 [Nitrosomonas ureae]
MCQLMGVSRSAYYDYVRRTDNYSEKQCHEEILETVRGIAKSSNHSYGSRKSAECVGLFGWSLEGSEPNAGSRRAVQTSEKIQSDNQQ